MPSNQQNQQTWSRLHPQCRLKTLNVVEYGAISRRLVWTIQILVTFETDDNYSIGFEISNNSSTNRFDSKCKNTICTALNETHIGYTHLNTEVTQMWVCSTWCWKNTMHNL